MATKGKRPFVEVTTPDRWGTELQRNIKGAFDQLEEIRRGLLAFAAVIKAGDYTIGEETFIVYTGPGGHTFTVPKSTALGGKARAFYVLNLGSGANGDLSIAASGSDTIDDTSRIALGAGRGVTLVNDGASQSVSQSGGFGSGAASWSASLYRYFFVDYDGGDDRHVGYIDAAAGTTFTAAAASAVALKTTERLYELVPQLGNGRSVCILQKPRAAFANYLDKDGVTQSSLDTSRYYGYRSFIWRGSTDLTNDTADHLTCGFGIAVAGPNGDSSFTVAAGATTSTLPIAAGVIAAEGATQFRIRFLATTTTASLRNICRVVTSCVANTSVTAGNVFPAAAAAGDVFVIERPGVRMNRCNFDARGLGTHAVSGAVWPAIVGIGFTTALGNAFTILGTQPMLSGCEITASTTTFIVNVDRPEQLIIDVAWFDETTTNRAIGMGLRLACGSSWNPSTFCSVAGFGAMNSAATTNIQIPGTGSSFGSRSYFGGTTNVQGVGAVGCRESGGACRFGDNSTANQQPRVVSGGSVTPFAVFNGPASLWRVNFENFGAATHGCVYIKNLVGGSLNIDGCTGDGTATLGVDISGCFETTFQFGNTIANTVIGSAGEIKVGAGALVSHADLTKVGFVDPNGNVVKGTADMTAGVTVAVTNAAGAGLAPGNTVYLSAASTVAKSNAAAAPTAIIDGIMVSTTANGGVGLMAAPDGLPYVLCEVAPAANAKMYLSAVTPGTIVGAAPGIPIIVGRNIDGNGVKTAVRVSMNPR